MSYRQTVPAVSTSYAPNWTHWQRNTYTLFGDISHEFADNWRLKAAVNRTEGEVSSLRVYATGFPDRTDGSGLTLLAGVGAGGGQGVGVPPILHFERESPILDAGDKMPGDDSPARCAPLPDFSESHKPAGMLRLGAGAS